MSRKIQNFFSQHTTRKAPKPQKRLAACCKFGLHLEFLEERDVPANFTAGDLAVLQLATNVTTVDNTTGTVLELAPTGTNQTPALTRFGYEQFSQRFERRNASDVRGLQHNHIFEQQ